MRAEPTKKSDKLFGGVFFAVCRRQLRRIKIRARSRLTPERREAYSAAAVERLVQLPAFREAETVLLYAHTKSELSLDALKEHPAAAGKRLLYPLCVSDREMIALLPEGEDAWTVGYCGIPEPVRERSAEISPEAIDLVICPCTSFDRRCNRLGMGAGFYDRYLSACVRASACAVAFEAQKAIRIPTAVWDRPMDAVVTEKAVYYRKRR